MLYHQVPKEESSGSQQSAEQLFVILGMFARITCGHQNQFIIVYSKHYFTSAILLKINFEAQMTLSVKD